MEDSAGAFADTERLFWNTKASIHAILTQQTCNPCDASQAALASSKAA
jgi:hypothetical protein